MRNTIFSLFSSSLPQTPEARIQELDAASKGFLYMVSTASTTGAKSGFGEEQYDYFKRIGQMGLQNEQVVGFGIHDSTTFEQATSTAKGAIIGSGIHQTLRGARTRRNRRLCPCHSPR